MLLVMATRTENNYTHILYVTCTMFSNPAHRIQYVVSNVIAHVFDRLTCTADEASLHGCPSFLLDG